MSGRRAPIRGATCCKRPWAAATSLSLRRWAPWLTRPAIIFLLCTDGLVEGLHDSHLEEFLRPPESTPPGTANPADRLVEESLARDGRDNTTALVIRVV